MHAAVLVHGMSVEGSVGMYLCMYLCMHVSRDSGYLVVLEMSI